MTDNPLDDVEPQSLIWIDHGGNYNLLTEGTLAPGDWREIAVLQFALHDALAWVEGIAALHVMPTRFPRGKR